MLSNTPVEAGKGTMGSAFSPDGGHLVVCQRGRFSVYDVREPGTPRFLKSYDGCGSENALFFRGFLLVSGRGAGIGVWRVGATPADLVAAHRRDVLLPLKPGFAMPPEIGTAAWQRDAPAGYCRVELQWLQAGPLALLGLPGEPFTSIGRAIRAQTGVPNLMIAALANDCSQVNYIAETAEYDLGGYELATTPAGPGVGEALVTAAGALGRSARQAASPETRGEEDA